MNVLEQDFGILKLGASGGCTRLGLPIGSEPEGVSKPVSVAEFQLQGMAGLRYLRVFYSTNSQKRRLNKPVSRLLSYLARREVLAYGAAVFCGIDPDGFNTNIPWLHGEDIRVLTAGENLQFVSPLTPEMVPF